MIKNILLLVSTLALLGGCQSNSLANHTQDQAFGVHHYRIELTVDFQQEQIQGKTTLKVSAKENAIDTLALSLLEYQVDSVVLSNQEDLPHQYNDTALTIALPEALQKGDTARLSVFYQGNPPIDATGWGGFYFRQGFAFNLGVGFGAKPHNFGRAWFPCVDNFTDRATYDFHITTPATKKAFCNGRLQSVKSSNNKQKTWHWKLKDPIPTYLASVAVGPYATVKDQYQGLRDTFPITYAVKPSDSTQLKRGFRNIDQALDVFTHFYGAQPFSRVGYSIIPFRGGAMEHATNIAYPQTALAQSLDDQRLWAHELSHHWWGDLTTTHRAEEMWLNEGWATFSEFLFLDHVYGDSIYQKAVKQNHFRVLATAHKRDGQYRPLVPVPHEATYGVHSYNKGGAVINTLRHHLGDTLFRQGIQRFLTNRAFQPMTSTGFRDTLEAATGRPLQAFFRQWVFNPGYPHFSLKQLTLSESNGTYTAKGLIQQKRHEAPAFFENVKLPVTAYFEGGRQPVTRIVQVGGKQTSFSMELPARPAYLTTDPNGQIADAKTVVSRKVGSAQKLELTRVRMDMSIEEVANAATHFLAEHHWVGPGAASPDVPGFRLSKERYWRLAGPLQKGMTASATLRYDSAKHPDGLNLDKTDNLVLLYRSGRSDQWQEYGSYEKDFLGNTGIFQLKSIKEGYYCFGKKKNTSGQGRNLPNPEREQLKLFPQPAKDRVRVELKGDASPFRMVQVYSMRGKTMIRKEQPASGGEHWLSTLSLSPGSYILRAVLQNNRELDAKLIIQ